MKRLRLLSIATCAACVFAWGSGCGSTKGATAQEPKGESQAQSSPPSAAPTQADNIDPRNFITEDEATEIVSRSVKFTEVEQLGQFASLSMENETGNIIAQLQVSTITYTKEAFDSDVAKSAKMLDAKFEPVEGLGESAYWMDGLMQVYAKGRWVQATVFQRPGLEAKPAARAILEKALAKLP